MLQQTINFKKGSTLLDVIIGSAIMLVVFVGFLSLLQIGTKLSFDNKARISAVSLANERMEYLHSLSYADLGTLHGIPSGDLQQTEQVTLNNITFIRRTLIQYIDDPKDGLGDEDENGITADYKKARVEVSWSSHSHTKSIVLISNFAPTSIESLEGGGSLIVHVFDATVAPIEGTEVHIINTAANPNIDVTTYSNEDGKVIFPGSPAAAGYQITVTKPGYSTEQTYDADANNPNPNPGHLTVADGVTTSKDFFIDTLGSIIVKTFEVIKDYTWQDDFANQSNIATSTDIALADSKVSLATGTDGYESDGSLIATTTTHEFLHEWQSASWNNDTPAGTEVKYHIYNSLGELVPNSALPNNSFGFTNSPIDLSSISTTTYPAIALGAELNTTSTSTTPAILDWQIAYSAGPTPLPNIALSLHGNKTIGEKSGNPIYKFSTTTQTGADANVTLENTEWDQYSLEIENTSYDIQRACEPLPLNLQPGATATLSLYLTAHTTHSLLVDVRDSSGNLLEDATVTLSRSGFNEESTTGACGQTFFKDLTKGSDYTLDVSKSGYQNTTENDVVVNGTSKISVTLISE